MTFDMPNIYILCFTFTRGYLPRRDIHSLDGRTYLGKQNYSIFDMSMSFLGSLPLPCSLFLILEITSLYKSLFQPFQPDTTPPYHRYSLLRQLANTIAFSPPFLHTAVDANSMTHKFHNTLGVGLTPCTHHTPQACPRVDETSSCHPCIEMVTGR